MICKCHGKKACPEFGEGVSHRDRSVVLYHSGVIFFVKEGGMTALPAVWCVSSEVEALHEEV